MKFVGILHKSYYFPSVYMINTYPLCTVTWLFVIVRARVVTLKSMYLNSTLVIIAVNSLKSLALLV